MWKYLLALLVLATAGCGRDKTEKEAPRSVHVATVGEGDAAGTKRFAGVVEEDQEISLGFKTAGQIKRIYVKEGDRVAQGQLLAELDNSDYRLGVEALQIQYDQLSHEVERAKRLYEKKSMTANDYEKATAGLRQLGVQLQVNKNKLAYTRLYAPVAGVIESVNFSPAEMVDAGTALFTMLNLSKMEVVCDVPASTYLERGGITSITCRPTHGGEDEYRMSLLSIVPKADSNQLYRMRLAFAGNPGRNITAGMNVEVSLQMNSTGSTGLAVPAGALFLSKGKECVWVVGGDSTVVRREVTTTGTLSGGEVTVTAGLSPGERIVRAGAGALHEGEKVRIIEKPASTNVGGLL